MRNIKNWAIKKTQRRYCVIVSLFPIIQVTRTVGLISAILAAVTPVDPKSITLL